MSRIKAAMRAARLADACTMSVSDRKLRATWIKGPNVNPDPTGPRPPAPAGPPKAGTVAIQHRQLAWQAHVFHEEMDNRGVPRADGEDNYSIIGRVNWLIDSLTKPIPMVLYCPSCGEQHIDAPSEEAVALIEAGIHIVCYEDWPRWSDGKQREIPWNNPPHRSHLCGSCGTIWRPADVATTGVAAIETVGKNDTWVAGAEANINYGLKAGDIVTDGEWALTPLIVVAVNWHTRSVALRLGENGGYVVWPAAGLRKVDQ